MENKFSQEKVRDLLNNKNVIKCSGKAITYSKDFKVLAVKQYVEEGKSAKEIFRAADFDLDVIGKDTPKDRLKDWKYLFRVKGVAGLQNETRGKGGGRIRTKWLDEKERIKYLEAQVAYLKLENDFLTKLRAKRRAE